MDTVMTLSRCAGLHPGSCAEHVAGQCERGLVIRGVPPGLRICFNDVKRLMIVRTVPCVQLSSYHVRSHQRNHFEDERMIQPGKASDNVTILNRAASLDNVQQELSELTLVSHV